MPQHVLNYLHVVTGRQGQCGGAVAEVVQPDRGQPGFGDEVLERVGDICWVQGAAVWLGE
nr:hypothetical protein [Amycolatopsis aidingensis]